MTDDGSRDHDQQSNTSGRLSSWISQTSPIRDTSRTSLRPEMATWIRSNVQALQANLNNPEELVRMAMPLFTVRFLMTLLSSQI